MRTTRAWAVLLVLLVAVPLLAEARSKRGDSSRREESPDGKSRGKAASRPECVEGTRMSRTAIKESLGDLARHSKDPIVLTGQFQTAVQHFKQALQMIGERPPESTNEAANPIYIGYVLVRSAHAGVDSRIKDAKFPDPILKQKYKTIWDGRRAILQAHRHVNRPCPTARDVELAVQSLTRGIAILQGVLATGI